MVDEMVVNGKLVTGEQLLDLLFDPQARPSMRWLRTQTKAKNIPHIKIGHLVFFDWEMVRKVLAKKNLVRHRMLATP
jgi:hypothetical protein